MSRGLRDVHKIINWRGKVFLLEFPACVEKLASIYLVLFITSLPEESNAKDFSGRPGWHHFLERLGNILVESKTPCYAWALLPNHVHLLIRTGGVPLASLMRRLLTGYAVSYNHRYQRCGQSKQNTPIERCEHGARIQLD